ncbi:MAG: sporulation protein YunB [Clostridia bacterium]|nr:sporulation protein YunB [Clostridia bacterium]
MTASAGKNHAVLRRAALLMLLVLLCAITLEQNLTEVVLRLASARAEVLAVNVLNEAIEDVIAQGVRYDELVEVTLDQSGSVRLLQANAAGMNSLSSRVSLTAQEKLENLQDQYISVPLGSALGIALLSGAGPKIPVRILPVGAVKTEFDTEFTSAGINQTRHRVLLTMTAQVQLVLPTGAAGVQAVNQVAVAESIIVGEVPESFVNVGDDTDLLNLVP